MPASDRPSIQAFLKRLFSRKMLIVFLMGFSSGLPLLLIGSTLKARMMEAGVDLSVIGIFSLVGLPYTFKFLWAPFLDRWRMPFLGRRRGWLVVVQPLLALGLWSLGSLDVDGSTTLVAVVCLIVAFLSATQDILIDSYRRELLSTEELGWGSSLAVNGYRVAMLFAGAVALNLADHMNWSKVYWVMTALMSVGFLTTLLSPEPAAVVAPALDWKTFLIDPFKEFIQRRGAFLILIFVVVYKVGDSVASDWTNPFFIHLGFSNTEIGTVAKLVGFWATIGGGLVGGAAVLRIGIARALWIFGIFQAVSILGFAWLTLTGPNLHWLALVMAFECFASGMGTSAYAGFLAAVTDRRFTATQYALLSSLTSIPRVVGPTPTGFVIKAIGWGPFFVFCAVLAIPGLLLLIPLRRIVMSGEEWAP